MRRETRFVMSRQHRGRPVGAAAVAGHPTHQHRYRRPLMSDNTSIEWTTTTWNPTTGCDKVSPGCGLPRPGSDDEQTGRTGGCYAMTMARRLKAMGQEKYQNDGDPRTSGPGFGVTMHPDALTDPLGWTKPRKVFVNSMSDLFHEQVSDEFIAKVFAVMIAAPQHTFQVLTKRHGRMRFLLNSEAHAERVAAELAALWRVDRVAPLRGPVENIWLGVSAEDQKWADIRIPALVKTPAAIRFVSAEPLLGPITLHTATPTAQPTTSPAGSAPAPARTASPRTGSSAAESPVPAPAPHTPTGSANSATTAPPQASPTSTSSTGRTRPSGT